MNKPFLYLVLVSLVGGSVILAGLVEMSRSLQWLFVLLIGLASIAELVNTSMPIRRSSITFSVGTAVYMAVIPFWGPLSAPLVATAANLSIWVAKPKQTTWKKSLQQLFFNTGMHSTAVAIAGVVFLLLRDNITVPVIATAVAWLFAAVVYDQLNFWMVMGMLRLQHGSEFKPIESWKSAGWAIPINIVSLATGGAILAYAIQNYDTIGVLVFFLPIILSAYAFRLYVSRMNTHMDNLEAIVQSRNKERDLFLAILTHDMRAPLTTIGLNTELLQRYPHLVKDKPYMLRSIQRAQQTLSSMVEDILALSAYQADKPIQLDLKPVELAVLVESIVEGLRILANEKQIVLTYQSSTDAIVNVDKPKIERVVQNLIINGIKYTPAQGKVHITVQRVEDRVSVRVADTGMGISADELTTIFEPYYRVTEHQQTAVGTGLGLAAAKLVVEAHGGEIYVESVKNEGSLFTISLPVSGTELAG